MAEMTWLDREKTMKYLFGAILLLLIFASVGQYMATPEASSELPILYWVTDPNPARDQQISKFHQWLKVHAPAKDQYILRLDAANQGPQKLVIQGVSGVAGDLIDVTGFDMDYLVAIGMLDDVTDSARVMGFDPSQTFSAVEPVISSDERQYLFPGNVWGHMVLVNKDAFAKYNIPLPPKRWNFDQFEALGKAFVQAANVPGEVQKNYFINSLGRPSLRGSLGLSWFNETMTRCTLDDTRNAALLARLYKWTHVDHILPTPAEIASFSASVGYGGTQAAYFYDGKYACLMDGRNMLIQMRLYSEPVNMTAVEPPNDGYPNTAVCARAVGIYKGSKHRDLARYFLEFLASEEYNRNIVADADALPPNPKYTQLPEYIAPPDYPNEGDLHQAFDVAFREIGVSYAISPFVLYSVSAKIELDTFNGMMSSRYGQTPEEAGSRAAQISSDAINREIERSLAENKQLRPEYDKRLAIQQQVDKMVALWNQIDAAKAQGAAADDLLAQARSIGGNQSGTIPSKWIYNPFYRKYYKDKGWAE